MAATKGKLTKHQQEQVRLAIKTTQLVKRLQQFGLGEDDEAGQPVELDSNRIRAIDILLKKSLPDLQNIIITGDEENPLAVKRIERVIVDPANPDS